MGHIITSDGIKPDDDKIKCSLTSDGNIFTNHNPAFQLDQSQCILSYNPALDNWKTENSVLQIEIQDYKEVDTEYFSRIPVQFTTKILKEDESGNSGEERVNNRCSRLSFTFFSRQICIILFLYDVFDENF